MEMVHFIPPSQRRLVLLAAQTDTAPALIVGSSGTGKSAIAKWIHQSGPRASFPLITVSRNRSLASQLPEGQGGTIVIPEIGEWPLSEQKVLLHFLETKSIPHPTLPGMRMVLNVRIIATTSQSLEGRAQGGIFNESLLKKLRVFQIEMPDLTKRNEEFEDLVVGILQEIAHEIRKEHIHNLSPQAWEKLHAYDWPGNLRELRNVLRVSVIQAKGDLIEAYDLPDLGNGRIDFRAKREEFEKGYILELLKTFDWQIDKTCQVSRIDKNTLLSKMKKYGIDVVSTTSVR